MYTEQEIHTWNTYVSPASPTVYLEPERHRLPSPEAGYMQNEICRLLICKYKSEPKFCSPRSSFLSVGRSHSQRLMWWLVTKTYSSWTGLLPALKKWAKCPAFIFCHVPFSLQCLSFPSETCPLPVTGLNGLNGSAASGRTTSSTLTPTAADQHFTETKLHSLINDQWIDDFFKRHKNYRIFSLRKKKKS